MGLFDKLLGLKTNDSLDKATQQQTAALGQTQNTNAGILNNSANAATGALTTGANSGLASLLGGFGNANGALTNYGGQAQSALTSAVDRAVGTVQGSNGTFQPYVDRGQAAGTMYSDALGLNGASGNAAATSAFQAAPGYQYQVDQATDAAARKAASLGMAASGNTLDAITRLGSNLADQQYGSWLDRLNGVSNTGLSAAGSISGNNATAAGFQSQGGGTLASLLSTLGSGISSNDAALGTGQSALQSALGTNLGNVQTNLGNSLTNNNWTGQKAITGTTLNNAASQDAVDSSNNGIFSKLIFGGLGDFMGGTATGKGLSSFLSKI